MLDDSRIQDSGVQRRLDGIAALAAVLPFLSNTLEGHGLEGIEAPTSVLLVEYRPRPIVSHLAESLLRYESRIPVITGEGARQTAGFVGYRSVVIALIDTSFWKDATQHLLSYLDRGATLICVVPAGGRQLLPDRLSPAVCVELPAEMQSNGLLDYGFLLILEILARMGLGRPISQSMGETSGVAQRLTVRYGLKVPARQNLAKQLALEFLGRKVLVFGLSGTTEAVARRWAQRLSVGGSQVEYFILPDARYEDLSVWEETNAYATVVMLGDSSANTSVKDDWNRLSSLARELSWRFEIFGGTGSDVLTRIVSLMVLSDYIREYMGVLKDLGAQELP